MCIQHPTVVHSSKALVGRICLAANRLRTLSCLLKAISILISARVSSQSKHIQRSSPAMICLVVITSFISPIFLAFNLAFLYLGIGSPRIHSLISFSQPT